MLENSGKCQKNPKKYWNNSHGSGKCPKCKKPSKYSNKLFCWLKILGKFPKNYQKFQNIYTYFIKISLIFFINEIAYNSDINVFSALKIHKNLKKLNRNWELQIYLWSLIYHEVQARSKPKYKPNPKPNLTLNLTLNLNLNLT